MKEDIGLFKVYDEAAEFGGSSNSKKVVKKENTASSEDEILDNGEEVCERVQRKEPLSLKKVAVGGALIGGSLLLIVTTGSCAAKRKQKKVEPLMQQSRYELLVENDEIKTSSFYQLIDEPSTSLDELINKDKEQYKAYEKFRSMLRAKEQFIDPKKDNLKNYSPVELSYYDIDENTISKLNDLYYQYYNMYINASVKNDTAAYETFKALFDETCVQLVSADHAINAYQEKYGNQLVADVAAKVLASKVIDTNGNIIPGGVSNIQGEYSEDGTMRVSFTYDNFGNTVKVVSDPFKNQRYDMVENLAKDIANNNNLRAIHETKLLANDSDYVIHAEEGVDFKSR